MITILRKIIRSLLQIGKYESIEDGLRRKRKAILSKFYHKKLVSTT